MYNKLFEVLLLGNQEMCDELKRICDNNEIDNNINKYFSLAA